MAHTTNAQAVTASRLRTFISYLQTVCIESRQSQVLNYLFNFLFI